MNNAYQLLRLLQLNGGTFPTGGFSQSWGLETCVTRGEVTDPESFRVFLESFLRSSIGKCEGPIIRRAYELTGALAGAPEGSACTGAPEGNDGAGAPEEEAAAKLRELEQISCAVKVTKESREAGLRMGKAFARILEPVLGEEVFQPLRKVFGGLGISYPVVYGCVCSLLELDLEQALAAYVFSTANTLTQSALKLIPLGNVEAQKVLFEMEGVLEQVTCLCMETDMGQISNFCPDLDIASLAHEELPVRLYMS